MSCAVAKKKSTNSLHTLSQTERRCNPTSPPHGEIASAELLLSSINLIA